MSCEGQTDRQTHNLKVRSGPVQGRTDRQTDRECKCLVGSKAECLQSDRWTHKVRLTSNFLKRLQFPNFAQCLNSDRCRYRVRVSQRFSGSTKLKGYKDLVGQARLQRVNQLESPVRSREGRTDKECQCVPMGPVHVIRSIGRTDSLRHDAKMKQRVTHMQTQKKHESGPVRSSPDGRTDGRTAQDAKEHAHTTCIHHLFYSRHAPQPSKC